MKLNTYILINVLLLVFQGMTYAQKPSSLFVHYDKTVYTENETIWFTAYLLKTEIEATAHNLLSVVLINEDSRKIAVEERFIMQEGVSFGNIKLPDSIASGNYYLVAYTNMKRDSIPVAEYIQPITVKTAANQTYELTLKVLDTAATPGEVHVLVSARNSVFQRIPDAFISYTVGRGAAVTRKTNKQGQYLIKIPKEQITPSSKVLTVEMRHDKEAKHLSLQLPLKKNNLQLGFYPEGGQLVANLDNRVAWEAKLSNGQPVSLTAIVFEGTVPVDTIQTSGYGIGQFRLKPRPDADYYVKLKGIVANVMVQQQYVLPTVSGEGVILQAEEAVVEDTLRINIASAVSKRVAVRIHREGIVMTEVLLNIGPYKKLIKVDLTHMPRGLTTMTVYDAQNRPLAERIFFSHYGKQLKLKIEPSSMIYKPREKVHLRLSLNDEGRTDSLLGLVSIACVQSNRLELLKQSNIENFFYLEQNLASLPLNPMGKGNYNKRYLEDILLVRGWRRYTDAHKADGSAYSSPEFYAQVTRSGKPIKKPVSLMLIGASGIQYLPGDSTGLFQFKNSDLLVMDNKKLHFFINKNEREIFDFEFYDPYRKINTYYTKTEYDRHLSPFVWEQTSEVNILKGAEKVIQLEEVVIRGEPDHMLYGSNECGDYVCPYNILNCNNHPTGRPAVKGQRYMINGRISDYFGCNPERKNSTVIRGINMFKEYYGSDYEVFNPSEGEYISTIYWKHAVRLKKDVKEIDFYTSDITGKFKVIVQGVTTSGVVYAEREIEVRK
jgi:hypothetical protein